MKCRSLKSSVFAKVCLSLLGIALIFGVLWKLEVFGKTSTRGELHFPVERPVLKTKAAASSGAGPVDRLMDGYKGLMTWDKNPWKIKYATFGDHYIDLFGSKNPSDIARIESLQRRSDALHKQVLARYPELAVPDKNVAPERNGFLKFIELSERFDADSTRPGTPRSKEIGVPEDLKSHLRGEAPWNADAARKWLAGEQPLMDEIRAIGLMPEQSIAGIEIGRWGFLSARLAKSCVEGLLIEARLAAGDGDVSRAMKSVQAANGLARHFAKVETPSLLAITVQILIQLQIQHYALSDILPALPPGQLDPEAWEKVVNPTVSQPSEFGRIMRGEWNVEVREFLLPMIANADDPKYPSDPEALIDYHAGVFLHIVKQHEGLPLSDLPTIRLLSRPDDSHLSRQSRQTMQDFWVGAYSWRKGWDRAQSAFAMTQAAFAIMKGQPIPNDPIYGLPYVWDPVTRELSQPASPAFKSLELIPIIVPKP